MSDEYEREPAYDPESVGLPDTVDPDSSAYDETDSVREADGPSTPLSPFHTPAVLDDDEVTSLDQRLRAEEPDFGAGDLDDDGVAQVHARADRADGEREEDYDFPDDDGDDDNDDDDDDDGLDDTGAAVGRLAGPDDDGSGGLHNATFAEDEGFAGGGASAEESAMHIINE
jgi:hypothetical protein